MTQTARETANTAKPVYDFAMIHDDETVRDVRTFVKGVDCVPAFCDSAYMAGKKTTGEILLALKMRAGELSLDEIARLGGYAGKSSVQAFFNAAYDGPLSPRVAQKLAAALAGRGSPAIREDEITGLIGHIPEPNGKPVKFEGSSAVTLRDDLPIFGTALGAPKVIDGEAVEQTTLNRGEVVEYVKRPTILNGMPDAYGLYVQGSSMHPAHSEGDLILVQAKRPPRVGDDVVVYLRCNGDDDDGERARGVMVKRLVRRTGQYIELEQFTPALTFRIDAEDVLRIDRVLTMRELLG